MYFSNTLASTQNISDTESSFNISLNRIKTDGELTVNLTLDDASGIYSIPSSVSFADGEDEVSIPVSYDPTKLEYDDSHRRCRLHHALWQLLLLVQCRHAFTVCVDRHGQV